MTTQPLEGCTPRIPISPRCPNCGKTIPAEFLENLVHLAVRKQQQLLKGMLEAHEQDQQALEIQIHENLIQPMVGAMLQLGAARQLCHRDAEKTPVELDAVAKLLEKSIDHARRITNRLRPPALDHFGILAGIEHLLEEARKSHAGLEAEFAHTGKFGQMPPSVTIGVFRIVQELLANACYHSETDRLKVELVSANSHLRLMVRDWGIGFDPGMVVRDCLGLDEVRERTALLGGKVTVESAVAEGTTVIVEIPLRDGQ
jgi:signal transduction histidine kinase